MSPTQSSTLRSPTRARSSPCGTMRAPGSTTTLRARGHGLGGVVALLGALAQHALDHGEEVGLARVAGRRRAVRLGDVLHAELRGALAVKGRLVGGEQVRRGAEGVEVGAPVDRRLVPLLGRHERGRAHEGLGLARRGPRWRCRSRRPSSRRRRRGRGSRASRRGAPRPPGESPAAPARRRAAAGTTTSTGSRRPMARMAWSSSSRSMPVDVALHHEGPRRPRRPRRARLTTCGDEHPRGEVRLAEDLRGGRGLEGLEHQRHAEHGVAREVRRAHAALAEHGVDLQPVKGRAGLQRGRGRGRRRREGEASGAISVARIAGRAPVSSRAARSSVPGIVGPSWGGERTPSPRRCQCERRLPVPAAA
jgi:hypothetical protein